MLSEIMVGSSPTHTPVQWSTPVFTEMAGFWETITCSDPPHFYLFCEQLLNSCIFVNHERQVWK